MDNECGIIVLNEIAEKINAYSDLTGLRPLCVLVTEDTFKMLEKEIKNALNIFLKRDGSQLIFGIPIYSDNSADGYRIIPSPVIPLKNC